MKRCFITLLGAIALMVGLLGVTPQPAYADEKNTSSSEDVKMTFKTTPRSADGETEQEYSSCEGIDVNTGNGDCADTVTAESSSTSSTEAKVVSINGVSIHSEITVLANIRANGTPKAQQTNCFRTKKAMSLYTSYNAAGTTGWHWKFYPAGYRFCKINGKVRDPECHNQVKIGVPKSNPPKNTITGKVKFVKRIVFKAVSVSKIHEKVVARSKSWCNTANTHAYGEGRGAAEIWAKGRAVLKGRVLVKLFASVNAASQGDLAANLEAQGVIDVKGQTKSSAYGKAVAESSSKAVCTETEQPPTYDECPNIPGDQPEGYECYPPTTNNPPSGEIVQWPQHMYVTVSDSNPSVYHAKVVGGDPEDGGNVTLNYQVTGAASIFVDANHPTICDVEGGQKVCTFWIKSGSTTGNATLKLTVKDSTGKESPLYEKSWPIVADEF